MTDTGLILKFISPKAEAIAKDISNCINKWQNQQPVSAEFMGGGGGQEVPNREAGTGTNRGRGDGN